MFLFLIKHKFKRSVICGSHKKKTNDNVSKNYILVKNIFQFYEI